MPPAPDIHYYFAPMSGYAYLGHARFEEIAAKAGAKVTYHPLDMGQVFAAAGSFPPSKYPDIRQKHRKADLVRWAKERGLPLNPTPAFWPVPMDLACRVITAAGDQKSQATDAILSAVWAHDLNIGSQEDIERALKLNGVDPDPIMARIDTEEVIRTADATTQHAIEIGIFGSPTYVIGEDWFFGQDRLEFLQRRLNESR